MKNYETPKIRIFDMTVSERIGACERVIVVFNKDEPNPDSRVVTCEFRYPTES